MDSLPRIYPIIDTDALLRKQLDPVQVAIALLEAGARWLQFRHKAPWTRATASMAERIFAAARANGARLIINDRADFAALFGHGVHLGQADLEPSAARRLLPAGAIAGLSTHNAAQLAAAAAEPVDYVALGPIFATGSKQNPDPAVGLDNLRCWRNLSAKPLAAIGGITLDNAEAVWAAGADSVAVIGGLLPPHPSPASIRERMTEWLKLSGAKA